MDAAAWDERFAVELVGRLHPARALDVACGEGRNALWLAQQGWRAQATDFSPVAIERLEHGGSVLHRMPPTPLEPKWVRD